MEAEGLTEEGIGTCESAVDVDVEGGLSEPERESSSPSASHNVPPGTVRRLEEVGSPPATALQGSGGSVSGSSGDEDNDQDQQLEESLAVMVEGESTPDVEVDLHNFEPPQPQAPSSNMEEEPGTAAAAGQDSQDENIQERQEGPVPEMEGPSSPAAVGSQRHFVPDWIRTQRNLQANLQKSKKAPPTKRKELPLLYECQFCPRRFASQSGRYLHQQSVHLGVTFSCQFCSRKFFRNCNRNHHMEKCRERGSVPNVVVPEVVPEQTPP